MAPSQNDFLKRLLITFQGEAEERLRALTAGLMELERAAEGGNHAPAIEQIFREVHSLKGAARSVNLGEIEAVCQAMEDVFGALKQDRITTSLPMLDTLHQATAHLKELLLGLQGGPAQPDRARNAMLIRQIKELAAPTQRGTAGTGTEPSSKSTPSIETVVSAPQPVPHQFVPIQPAAPHALADERNSVPAETVRIATDRLESLLLQVEELVSAKLSVSQRAAELRQTYAPLDEWDKRWAKTYPAMRTVATALEALPHAPLTLLLEFLEWNHGWVEQMESRLATLSNAANRDQRVIGGMVDHLLQDMKQVLMLPVSSILEIFPSTCRDLARQQAKEVQLLIRGAEIEVDRRILQEIKDPLMHLVRNAIDHGLETGEVRARHQKPARGTITLTVTQRDSSKFEIALADDGGGIDLVNVRTVAARLGIASAESAARMSEQETRSLLFQSGFSTSPLITDISGRGLGLAIVQEKVEKLGGSITLETEPSQGTTFRLLLPLTLATLRGLLVKSEAHTFILPITHVERVARLRRGDIQTVQNREMIRLAGQAYSLVRLGQALELPAKPRLAAPSDSLFVVILVAAEKRIAFAVDEIIGEQEVLMKPLGAQLARVRNVAGATVLGNGQVIPILNALDLIKSAIRLSVATNTTYLTAEESPRSKDQRILIVEDSITARMQLKNILELSGYTVTTAVDGLDALLLLRGESFDLVVSDVDMPRLNGLDLTSRIRNDKKLADLPVVLVTTLASREDQARGIEVGANAYITKSNFDQNRLLDAIERLI